MSLDCAIAAAVRASPGLILAAAGNSSVVRYRASRGFSRGVNCRHGLGTAPKRVGGGSVFAFMCTPSSGSPRKAAFGDSRARTADRSRQFVSWRLRVIFGVGSFARRCARLLMGAAGFRQHIECQSRTGGCPRGDICGLTEVRCSAHQTPSRELAQIRGSRLRPRPWTFVVKNFIEEHRRRDILSFPLRPIAGVRL